MVAFIIGGTASERAAFVRELSRLAVEEQGTPWVSCLSVSSVGDWGEDAAAGKIVDVGRWCCVLGEARSLWGHVVIACDDFGRSGDVAVDAACDRAMGSALGGAVDITFSIDEAPEDGAIPVRNAPRAALTVMMCLWR